MTGNEKSIVESTLLQIKAVEDAISENAKGILASTMKEEISELVKESLSGSKKSKLSLHEQDEEGTEISMEDEDELEDEIGGGDELEDETEMFGDEEEPEMDDEDEEFDVDMDFSVDDNEEMPPLDMTQSPMSDVIKVFKAMGDEDGIIVKKDGKFLQITDNETNNDYMVQLEESEKKRKMKSNLKEEVLYELHFNDDKMEDLDMFETYLDEEDDNETIYELEVGEQDSSLKLSGVGEMDDEPDWDLEEQDNVQNPPQIKVDSDTEMSEQEEEEEYMGESFKPKGNVGKMKFKYPSKLKKGVAETAFEKEMDEMWEEDMDEELMSPEDEETAEKSEAARTLGNGRRWGRKGLPKPKAAPRHLNVESVNSEINLLREKNDEYKKALDFFRNKLNEVAVFNSNLAYSTRLFTEHSTTKQEKINILRRFDNVETLKESKNLYKTIKNELDGEGSTNVVKESITEKVVKTPQNGSATNLIESKTYENPQFLRMKDLMTKIK